MARTDLEQLVFTMSADIRQMQKQLARASGDVDRTSRRIQQRMDQTSGRVGKALSSTFDNSRLAALNAGASRLGVVGGALEALGPAGLVAAAGIGAAAFALGQARRAMDFADEIADAAAKTHLGVEALQEYRLAALAAGVEMTDLDAAAEGFESSLGKLINRSRGFKAVAAALKDLGLTDEQIASIRTFEDFLEIAPDKFAQLGSAAKAADIANKLGVRPILPLLEQGNAAIDETIGKLRELGVIMDEEMVRKAGEAHDEAELLSKVIDLQLKMAFIELAPVIVQVLRVVADMARGIRELGEDIGPTVSLAGDLLSVLSQLAGMKVSIYFDAPGLDQLQRKVRSMYRLLANLGVPFARQASDALERQYGPGDDALRGMDYDGARAGALGGEDAPYRPRSDDDGGKKSKGRSGPSAAELARKEEERARRAADEIFRAQTDELEARQGFTRSLEERLAFEAEMLERRQAQERVELDRELADKKITDTEYAILKASMETRHAAEERNRRDKEFFELQDQELENVRAIGQLEADLLGIRSSMAKTAEERRKIELQLLELADQERRDALKRQLDRNEITPEQYAQRMGLLDQIKGASTQAINQRNQGPIGQFIQQAEITGDRLQELAVNGLGSLNAALIDSIGNARNAGEAIRNVFIDLAKQVLMMLLNQSTAQILTAFVPRFAQGTNYAPGGMAIVGEQGPELVNLPQGSKVTPTDKTIRALGGGRSGTMINVTQTISLAANGDRAIVSLVKAASKTAYQEAVRMAGRQQPGIAAKFRQLEA